MGTATFLSSPSDGYVASNALNSYPTAAAGNNLAATLTDLNFGQALITLTYFISQAFVEFDTSSLPDDAVVDSVALSLYGKQDNSATDFTMEVYAFDFGSPPPAAGDFRTPSQIAALTRVASRSSAGFTVSGYNAFASDATFPAAINRSGATRLLLVSAKNRTATAPTGLEAVVCHSSATTGTANDPKLVVTYHREVAATLAAPLGGLSGSAAAGVAHGAALAAPLGALTASAAADVSSPTSEVAASLTAPLGGLTAAGAATVDHPASLAAALGALTSSASGTVGHGATLAAPLGGLASSAGAGVDHPASLTASLGPLDASASAGTAGAASATAPLGGLSASGSAGVSHQAAATAGLGGLSASATAQVDVLAAATSTLGALVATAAAAVGHGASASAPLGGLSAAAGAAVSQVAVLSALLGGLAASGSATASHARDVTVAAAVVASPWAAQLDPGSRAAVLAGSPWRSEVLP